LNFMAVSPRGGRPEEFGKESLEKKDF